LSTELIFGLSLTKTLMPPSVAPNNSFKPTPLRGAA